MAIPKKSELVSLMKKHGIRGHSVMKKHEMVSALEGAGFGDWLYEQGKKAVSAGIEYVKKDPVGTLKGAFEVGKKAHSFLKERGEKKEKDRKERVEKHQEETWKRAMKGGALKKKKRTRVRGGAVEEEDVASYNPEQAEDGTFATPAQVQATQQQIQQGVRGILTPSGFQDYTYTLGSQIIGEKAWIYPFPSGYPQYLFYHPNQYSRNPNQVIMFTDRDDFMSSLFYQTYQSRIQYVPAPYEGFGVTITQDWAGLPVTPGKPFRIIIVDKNPDDADKWIFDANNATEYVKVINMMRGDDTFAASEAVLLAQAIAEALKEKYLAEGFSEGAASQKSVDDAVILAANEQIGKLNVDIKNLDQQISGLQEQLQQAESSSDDSGFWGDVGSFCGGLAEAFI